MKILIVLDHHFPPHARVENEMRSLTEAGHEVHLACFQGQKQPLLEHLSYCTIHRKAISKFTYKASVGVLKFPFYFNYWRNFVDELFKVEHFDAIHICDLPLAKVGYEAKCKYGAHFVLDLFENWPVLLQMSTHTNTFLGKLLSTYSQWVEYEKKMCALADKIIVVVDEAKTRIESLGVPLEKIVIVSNTLNINQFDPMERKGFDKEGFRMLYVGSVNYHRGLQYVIQAISILKKRRIKVQFDLVGDGSYLSNLKQLVYELEVNDMVVFHGFKLFTEIVDLYEQAHVALIPHIKSGHTDNTIPHKIYQYLYAEIPMIVSNCDPLVRIVNETRSGVSYHYDQPEELAAIIAGLYEHPEKLNDYIQYGRQAVIEKYNWSVDGKRLVDLYASLGK